jgi:hypothetical protein
LARREPTNGTSSTTVRPIDENPSQKLFAIGQQTFGSLRLKSKIPPPPKDWVVPPPPAEDTPQAWLVRASKAQEEYDQDQQCINYYPYLKDKFEGQFFSMSKINSETIQKLIKFGRPSIKLCIDQLLSHRPSSVSGSVLSGLGVASVEPLLNAMAQHPTFAEQAIQVFWQMQDNPGDELVRHACTPGATRSSAIKVLAFFVNYYDHRNETTCALARPEAIPEESRQPLLAQLKDEKNAAVRRDLLVVQRYFKFPDDTAIREISAVLKNDPAESVRAAAAEALGSMLEVTTVKGSPVMINALGKAISVDNSETVKTACAYSLCQARGKVDQSVLGALRTASNCATDSVRQAALRALSHLAIYDKDCVPDLVRALNSKSYPTVGHAVDDCIRIGRPAAAATGRLEEIERSRIFDLDRQAQTALSAIWPIPVSSSARK